MKRHGKKKRRGNNWSKNTTKKERSEKRSLLEKRNKKKKLFDKWMNFATSLNIDAQKKLLEMLPQFWGNKSDDLKVKNKAINHIMNIFSSPTSNADCPSVHDVSATIDLTSDCETKDAEATGDATKDPAEATRDATKDPAEATVSTTKDSVEANGDATKDAEATGSTTKDPADATGDATKTVDLTSDCETKDAEATGDATKDPAEATRDATKDPAEATVSTTKDSVEANGDATKDPAEATVSTTKDPVEPNGDATKDPAEATRDATKDAEATVSTTKDPVKANDDSTKDAEATGSTTKDPAEATGSTTNGAEMLLVLATSTLEKGPLTNTQAIKTTRSSERQEKTRSSKRIVTLRAKKQSNLHKNNSTRSDQQLIQSGQQDEHRSRVNHKRTQKAALEDKSTEIINRTEYLKSQANSLNGDPNAIFALLLERDNLKSELARADSCPWVREMYVGQALHDNILRFVESIADQCFTSKSGKYDVGFHTESWYDLNVNQKKVCYYYVSSEYIITYCTVFVNII